MKSENKTLEAYNNFASEFSTKFNKVWVRYDSIERAFSFFEKPGLLNVLEIGCGNWRDAKEILNYSTNYLGIDYSTGMLNLAREYLPDAKLLIQDIEEFQSEEKFDIIFSFASLVHLPKENMKIVLKKLYSLLNNNWILVLSLRHSDEYKEEVNIEELSERFFAFYNPEIIKELVEWFQFEFEKIKEINNRFWFEMILRK